MLYMSTSKCFVVILSETRAAHLTFIKIDSYLSEATTVSRSHMHQRN